MEMANETRVVMIHTGGFGPELKRNEREPSDSSGLISGGIRLSACREGEIDTKSLLPGISTRLVDRQSLQAGIATRRALSILPEGTNLEKAGVILGSSFGATASMCDFFRKIVTDGPNAISPMEFPNTVSNAAASRVGIWFSLRGHCISISNGNLSGLDAFGLADREIREGLADYFLVGGSEELSEIVQKIYAKVSEAGHEVDRMQGIRREILYEGAEMALLTSLDTALALRIKPICEITGYRNGTVSDQDSPQRTALNELESLWAGSGGASEEMLFYCSLVPGGSLSYAVVEEARARYGEDRVKVYNRMGDTLINYLALDGIKGMEMAAGDLQTRGENCGKALIFNVENDGRYAAVTIQTI